MNALIYITKLLRAMKLVEREWRDGCNECRAQNSLCHEHYKKSLKMRIEPKDCQELQQIMNDKPQTSSNLTKESNDE